MKNTPTGILCAGFATVRPLLLLKNNKPFQTVNHRAEHQLQRNVEEDEATFPTRHREVHSLLYDNFRLSRGLAPRQNVTYRSPLATVRQFPPVQRFGAKTERYIQKSTRYCTTISACPEVWRQDRTLHTEVHSLLYDNFRLSRGSARYIQNQCNCAIFSILNVRI